MSEFKKKIIVIAFLTTIILFPRISEATGTVLTVQARIGGQTDVIANFSREDLSALPQEQLIYSSVDADNEPMMIIAEGVPVSALLGELGVGAQEVESLWFVSSDNWSRDFSAAGYLETARYRYDEIAGGPDAQKTLVAPMIALRSYEGKFESSPGPGKMHEGDGLRFCFGQEQITDRVAANYGKHIKQLTIILNSESSYQAPGEPYGTGGEERDSGQEAADPKDVKGEGAGDEGTGLAADTLTVSVGYYGGPYHTKKVFTTDYLKMLSDCKM